MTRTVRSLARAALAALALAAAPIGVRAAEPMFGPQTRDRTMAALIFYQELQQRGGWAPLPREAAGLKAGASGAAVAALHQRLALTGDLDAARGGQETFDDATAEALRRFQSRHGLSLTGAVGVLTLRALNVPVETRVRQLSASLERLRGNSFIFASRYVVVNIPAAVAEAIENGQVARSHIAVVGKPDRASPQIEARITAVNLNPTWTAPLSIVKADIVPKTRADAAYLAKNNMRLIGAGGVEIDPATIDWTQTGSIPFSVRQDAGPTNSLGQLRIDMPNAHAVYMHDTPKKGLFRSDVRTHSSGCARIENVRDLAAWLLEGTATDRIAIEMGIESGETRTIRLAKSVPVAWIYLTAWGQSDGAVQFREDIYRLDGLPREAVAAPPVTARRSVPGDALSTGSVAPKPPGKPVMASRLGADEL
jgi:murein L,D-transpeptidase YcbB/YkuD